MITIKDKYEFCKMVQDMHDELDNSVYEAVEAGLNSLDNSECKHPFIEGKGNVYICHECGMKFVIELHPIRENS